MAQKDYIRELKEEIASQRENFKNTLEMVYQKAVEALENEFQAREGIMREEFNQKEQELIA